MIEKSGIYQIRNLINNKKYIGQATNIKNRWYIHKWFLRKEVYSRFENIHLFNAWKKYTESNFIFETIEFCNIEDLDKLESHYIHLYPREELYNINYEDPTTSRGRKYSEETLEKLRNRVVSEETRQKMSESGKKKIFSERHRENISKSNKNKAHSEEWNRKVSESKKKPIVQLDLSTGKIISEYSSASEAASLLNINLGHISQVCHNNRKSAGGFRWEYIDDRR